MRVIKRLSRKENSDCGSLPDDRMERYGDWKSVIGESIVYDLDTPRAMTIQLLIDDGTPTRGHRANVFNAGFKVIGVAVGEPSTYGPGA